MGCTGLAAAVNSHHGAGSVVVGSSPTRKLLYFLSPLRELGHPLTLKTLSEEDKMIRLHFGVDS